MARVFVSHASADLPVAAEVLRWLRADGHDPFLDSDLRGGVEVGEDWKNRLYQELRDVDAVLCIVSRAFVASTWCAAEVAVADARGCRLLPLRVEPGVVHPLMERLQYAAYHADAATARQRTLSVLRSMDAAGAGAGHAGWREGTNPYPGLEPFGAELASMFFGRSAETRELANRLRAAKDGELLAVVGPSGCGKSSLVRAGLLPQLADDPQWWVLSPFSPGNDPVDELAQAVALAANRMELGWSLAEVGTAFDHDDGLRRLAGELLVARPGPRDDRQLLIGLDQAEELFTRAGTAGREKLAILLREALSGPVRVVATLRSEFLDDLRTLPAFGEVPITPYLLAPLVRDMLPQVVTEPARVAGLRLDPELAARLVADTGSGEALPLLAFTLRQLADGLARGDTIPAARYDSLGGVGGALARHADAALADATAASGLPDQQVLAGLVRLTVLDEAGRRTGRRVDRATVPTRLQAAFGVFVDRRLLTATSDGERTWVGVAHEALLTAWPPLDTAIADRAAALHTARSVEQAAADWRASGHADHFLWDADRLAATLATLDLPTTLDQPLPPTGPVVDLDPDGTAFLTATADRVRTERRHARRRRARTLATLSVLLVLAIVGGSLAVVRAIGDRQSAEDAERALAAQNLVTRADAARGTNRALALQLAVAARALSPRADVTAAAEASLFDTLATPRPLGDPLAHPGSVNVVAFSPDSRTLATGSTADNAVRLWDLTNPAGPRLLGEPLVGHTDGVNTMAFSADGRTLASGSDDATVRLWDLGNPTIAGPLGEPLTGHLDGVEAVAFSPDGRTLASGSLDTTVRLWDVSNGAAPRPLGEPLTGHAEYVVSVAFSPDGRTLASGSYDDTVRLWDLTGPAAAHPLGAPLAGHTRGVNAVAFAPDGRTLATGSADTTVRLWDLADPAGPRPLGAPLAGHTRGVNAVAFSPDGRTLATGSGDPTVRLWDVADPTAPRPLGGPLAGHTDGVNTTAVSPDGRTLATGSDDTTVRLWDLADPATPRSLGTPLEGHTDAVTAVAVSPDGRTLATGSADTAVRLWDTTDPATPRQRGEPLAGHTDAVTAVAFSSDGRTLASGGTADTAVRLWDTTNPATPRQRGEPLAGHTSWVDAVAFSQQGRSTLATGSGDRTVRLWDLADPATPRSLGTPLEGHADAVTAVAFAPDGRTLATGSADTTVRLWDLADPATPPSLGTLLEGHTDDVSAVAFSPDGRTLATGSADTTVRLWNVADPATPRPLGDPLAGHADAVNAVAFSPDRRTLATASGDHTVRLWDLADPATPRPLGSPLAGHAGAVTAVAFSPDGNILASGSDDDTVRLWDASGLSELRRDVVSIACEQAGGLDRPAWEQYVPGDIDFPDPCRG